MFLSLYCSSFEKFLFVLVNIFLIEVKLKVKHVEFSKKRICFKQEVKEFISYECKLALSSTAGNYLLF